MNNQDKTKEQLLNELVELRQRVAQLQAADTERKRADDALRESEQRLALAVDGSNGGQWHYELDPDDPLHAIGDTYFSPRLKSFIGYEDNEFPNSLAVWESRVVLEDLPVLLERSRTHRAGQKDSYEMEYRIRHKDGSIRWIHSRGRVRRDERGRPIRFAGIDWDITERKRAEEDIRQHNRELAALNAITAAMMQSALHLDEVLRLTADGVVMGLGCNTGFILLLDEEEGVLRGEVVSTEAGVLEKLNAIAGYPIVESEIPARMNYNETMRNLLTGRTTIKHEFYKLIKPFWSKQVCSDMQKLLDSKTFFAMPLLAKGKTVGGLIASTPKELGEGDTEKLMTFANQAAIAIENARLYDESHQHALEQETLREAALALTTDLDRNEVIGRLLAQLQRVVPYDSASIQLLQGDMLVLIAGRGFPNLEDLLGVSFPVNGDNPNREVMRTLSPSILEDAPLLYEAFSQEPFAAMGIRSWLGAPMLIGERLVGMITLDKREPGFYTHEHARLAEAFAAQAAVAIENARLFEEEKRRSAQLALISEVSEKAASILEPDRLMQEATRSIQESFSYYNVALFLLDEERGEVVIQGIAGGFEHIIAGDYRQSLDEGTIGLVIRTGQSYLANDISKDPYYIGGFLEGALNKSELCVPVRLGDKVIGTLNVQSIHLNDFDQADVVAMEAVADRIAIAIENARLYEDTKRRVDELSLLFQAARDASASLEPAEVMYRLAEAMCQAADATSANVLVFDETGTRATVLAQYSSPEANPAESAPDDGMVYDLTRYPAILEIIRAGRPSITHVDDPALDPNTREMMAQFDGCSAMRLPLLAGGALRGYVLVWDSRRRHEWDDDTVRLCQTLAGSAAAALENARLFEEIGKRRMYLEGVLGAAPDAIVTLDAHHRVVEWNSGAKRLFGYSQEEAVGQNIDDLIAKPDVIEEAVEFTRVVMSGIEVPPTETVRYRKDGSPVDVIVAGSPILVGNEFIGLVAVYTDITKRVRMEETLRALALIDDLTGLYNRRGFSTLGQQQLKTANRGKRRMVLLFADFDGLKQINDAFGHSEGDRALIETADVLEETFRESDIVARIGGDEFVVLAIETNGTPAEVLATRFQENLKARNARGDRRYKLSLSVGLARYDPEHPCSIDELLAQADRAMYEKKRGDLDS